MAGHPPPVQRWVGQVSFLGLVFHLEKIRECPSPTHTQVPTLVWASLRTLAGFWRRQDTISCMDEVGQLISSAKAAACC